MADALAQRRIANFRANRRAVWSLWIFLVLFVLSLLAEFIANEKPILVSFRGEYRMPIFSFYSEADYGGEFRAEADYTDPVVTCLIATGGVADPCFDDPEGVTAAVEAGAFSEDRFERGWAIWPLIPFHFRTSDRNLGGPAPSPPDARHWLGTDDQARDVAARVLYGFRISVFFALIVTGASAVVGIAAGAVQGYFGGVTDLVFQRVIEIWQAIPSLYVIIIVAAIIPMTFSILTFLLILFSWTALVGVVRAEFLRGRNFEYVRAARALGVSDGRIMFRHVLPNAAVATLTFMPFLITASISSLATLDFLGFGLPPSYPSLGELALQGKNNITSPWLGLTAFFTFAVMLSLLVFIFEGIRDAFDPRKTFQ
ncbi:MAG: ABC transporter permease [Pseudomonadota bacterium]